MDRFLRLPAGELARVAAVQRKHDLRRELGEDPSLSGSATEAKVAFLKRLEFTNRRPTAL